MKPAVLPLVLVSSLGSRVSSGYLTATWDAIRSPNAPPRGSHGSPGPPVRREPVSAAGAAPGRDGAHEEARGPAAGAAAAGAAAGAAAAAGDAEPHQECQEEEDG
nr:uncharacterized protein LOC102087124 isoform X2 [Columba livia]